VAPARFYNINFNYFFYSVNFFTSALLHFISAKKTEKINPLFYRNINEATKKDFSGRFFNQAMGSSNFEINLF